MLFLQLAKTLHSGWAIAATATCLGTTHSCNLNTNERRSRGNERENRKQTKLHKVPRVAQGFSCLAVVVLSSKNIYSPKPNCLPRDRGMGVLGVMCVRADACVRLCTAKAHRKRIVGQTRNNTADCFPLTKKVWFLIVKQDRFTACGFKRLETEAIRRERGRKRESASYWADSRNVIHIIQLYKTRGDRQEKKQNNL